MTALSLGPYERELDEQDERDTARADRRVSLWFVHACLIGTIALQRFCIWVGGGAVYVCLLFFLAGAGFLLATGRARIRPLPAALFGLFTLIALVSTLIAVNTPDSRINGLSLPSLASVLIVYVGLIVGPTARFDGARTFALFVYYVRGCAILGLAQYFVQFAGVSIFAFGDRVPAFRPFLVEPLFNSHPVIAYGSTIMRSNGFFMVEPSIFSQFLMLAVAIDFFVRREWRWLPLYGAAYLYTFAGTGLLALAIAAALTVLLAPRSSPRLIALGAIGAVLLIAAISFAPDAIGSLLGRSNELSYTGSSGYARYMGQLDVLSAYAGETRTLIGYGPGALERADVPVAGSINAALKLFFEYGIFGLAAFGVYLIASLWRRDIAIVSLFLLVNYQMGGGYLLFMPLIVLSALLCVWSDRVAPREREDARDVVPA